MSPRDEANDGQPAVNDPARRPHDRERVVFVLGDGTHLTLHFPSWTWDSWHDLVPDLESIIHDQGDLPLEARVRMAAEQLGAVVLAFDHTPEDPGDPAVN